jgi:hypothetical protein
MLDLFQPPRIVPQPTRVIRLADVEPVLPPSCVYRPQIAIHVPPAAPGRMSREERLAKKRAYDMAYRARMKAAGRKKRRRPYSEWTEAEKAARREKQMAYYFANRERIAQRERERYRSMTPEARAAYNARADEWRKANRERAKELNRLGKARRRARLLAQGEAR